MIPRSNTSPSLATVACSVSLLCAAVLAQQPVPAAPAVRLQSLQRTSAGLLVPGEVVPVGAQDPSVPSAAQDPVKAAATAAANARITKLKQSFFDRRPSSILLAR